MPLACAKDVIAGITRYRTDTFDESQVCAPKCHARAVEQTPAEDAANFWRIDCHGHLSICLPVLRLNAQDLLVSSASSSSSSSSYF